MNTMQRIVLIGGALLIALMFYFPPYSGTVHGNLGYRSYAAPPIETIVGKNEYDTTILVGRVDYFRLTLQLAAAAAATGMLFVACRDPK